MHEKSLHAKNCFITLTYEDKYLPAGNTLVVADHQNFMKRLRFEFGPGIRFALCGEYGEKFGRPHYHALLFNHDFDDRVHWQNNANGDPVYLSKTLERVWGLGMTTVGEVTWQSAAYVSRYIMKKRTGDLAATHYEYVDEFGEIHQRLPEYFAMSRRPGIGKGWYEKYKSEVYPSDFIVMNGHKFRPPRYYDGLYELETSWVPRKRMSMTLAEENKKARARKSKKHAANNTPERLRVREEVMTARTRNLKRELE